MRLLLLLGAAAPGWAASLSFHGVLRSRLASSDADALRLRGGADDDAIRREIHTKLNGCPLFVILSDKGTPVGTRNAEGDIDVLWFVEPAEAKEQLEAIKASDSGIEGLHLGCTPLGDAFEICGGWDTAEAAHKGRKIQGPAEVVDAASAALVAQLQQQGAEVGHWLLPVFCCDDFQTDTLMPFFFSAEALQAGWVRNGRPEEDAPEHPLMMDIRTLVGASDRP
jgi:hypothetical protein|eukprot:Transcript_30135.p1 GENE.Transcript_30135~~Transcript_30135.p1  ORF type:complete len:252 (-),score=92.13 Transcript_30135:790-1461(-)